MVPSELFLADGTLEGFFARMRTFMILKDVLVAETTAADGTSKNFVTKLLI